MRPLRCTLVLAALSLTVAASAQGIRTTVDSLTVSFPDVQPTMVNGRVMVPVRGVFEHMGADVRWDSTNQTVNAQHGSDTIVLPLNSYTATINGSQVTMDTPATMKRGRVMVPLRFLSESLGANVEWLAASRTVEITSNGNTVPDTGSNVSRLNVGEVIPFSLNTRLSSSQSRVGDTFTARLDSSQFSNYQGLPQGSELQGHVDVVKAKTGNTPGVLGLKFDRVKMPDGLVYPIYGSLIGLDNDSVSSTDGRVVAKSSAMNDDLKWVGYGAGAGALLSILTHGNIIENSVIGAALGFLAGEIQKDPSKAHNVVLETGTKFGVRLTNEFAYRSPNKS